MRKKTRNILVILLVIASIFFISQGGFQLFSLVPQGFATLSIQQVALSSVSPYFNGQQWILTTVQNQLGQSVTGTFTPNDIQQYSSGEQTTEENLQVTINYQEQSCNYAIFGTSNQQPIKKVARGLYSCLSPTQSNAQSHAQGPVLYYGATALPFECFVIYSIEQSPIGNFQSPVINNKFTVNVNAGGDSASANFETLQGQIGGPVGDFAYAQWVGNLDSGQPCPTSNPYYALNVGGTWRVVNKQPVDLAINHQTSFGQTTGIFNEPTPSQLTSWVNSQNNLYSDATVQKQISGSQQITNPQSLTNAIVRIAVQSPLQFPVITLYIQANTLGIFTPVPEIDILSASSQCFATGEGGIINVQLKNNGQQAGGGSVSASCSSPFQSTGITQQVYLTPGETGSINIPVSASVTTQQTSTCTITSTSTGGATDTKTVEVCSNPQITCTVPYPQKYCSISGGQEVVKQCNQEGSQSIIIENCGVGETCSSGACVQQTTTGGISLNPIESIKGFFSNLFGGVSDIFRTIKLVLIGFVSVFSFFTTRDLLLRFKEVPKKAVLLISLGLTGGIIFLLYQFIGSPTFYAFVIAFALYWFFAPKIRRFRT